MTNTKPRCSSGATRENFFETTVQVEIEDADPRKVSSQCNCALGYSVVGHFLEDLEWHQLAPGDQSRASSH